ncbi:MAG: hypothetical protein OEM59_23060 [Rhodospirillales bacterium]|nr:hypothetical protein [Rhodospirillales bacterium]
MLRPVKQAEPIHGVVVPPRRFTRWAALYFVLFFCLPFLGLCLLLDVLLYLVFTGIFGRCYAILCLFD